jgi:hypothetical protein
MWSLAKSKERIKDMRMGREERRMKMYERNYCPPTEVANAYYQNSQVES